MALAYALAAVLCWRAAARCGPLPGRGEGFLRLFRPGARTSAAGGLWMGLAAFFGLMIVFREFELHTWLTDLGRAFARSEGWYQHRRTVQAILVAIVATVGAIVFLTLAWLTRRAWRTDGLAIAGATFIVTYIIIRAVSFHHIDVLLGRSVLGVRLNWVVELCGIACVAAAALFAQSTSRSRNPQAAPTILPAGAHSRGKGEITACPQ